MSDCLIGPWLVGSCYCRVTIVGVAPSLNSTTHSIYHTLPSLCFFAFLYHHRISTSLVYHDVIQFLVDVPSRLRLLTDTALRSHQLLPVTSGRSDPAHLPNQH